MTKEQALHEGYEQLTAPIGLEEVAHYADGTLKGNLLEVMSAAHPGAVGVQLDGKNRAELWQPSPLTRKLTS